MLPEGLRRVFGRTQWLAVFFGALSVLAWAPFYWAPLLWLTLAALYVLTLSSPTPRAGLFLGTAFGLGVFLSGVSWVYVSLSVFGGLPPALAVLSTFLFCLLLASFPGMAIALFVRYRVSAGWRNVFLFAAVWGAFDWLRGWIFSGY